MLPVDPFPCPKCGSKMATIFQGKSRIDFCGKCDDPFKSAKAAALVNAKALQPPQS
jgi:ribosomal protein L37AE/L43A